MEIWFGSKKLTLALTVFLASLLPGTANAQGQGTISQGATTLPSGSPSPCLQLPAGGKVLPPVDLYSANGKLVVNASYFTGLDASVANQFCFVTPEGYINPTLHVKPGDTFTLNLTNRVPVGSVMETVKTACGESVIYDSSLNLHFHGTLVSPACQSDDVVDTVINSGDTFQFNIAIPPDEPPGMYWYHPHLHGLAESALLGGGSGAFIVDGLENFQKTVAGLPARVLLMRDANTVGAALDPGLTDAYGKVVPTWDISLNNVPVNYLAGVNALSPVIEMKADQPELWRVVNAAANSVLDFNVLYDGKPQSLSVVALDGVPTGSHDATRLGKPITRSTIAMAPGARAEFVITPPGPLVITAVMQTQTIATGPAGDSVPSRTLAQIVTSRRGTSLPVLPTARKTWAERFEGLEDEPVKAKRKLFFSENISNPADPSSPTDFFITVDGATPTKFYMGMAPAITTTNGAVEEWTVENRSPEMHAFHMHQIHFKLKQVNGVPVSGADAQLYDDYDIPGWTGKGAYPSIKVKMDFRSPTIVGDFVYHCHILQHEDQGMMAVIRVLAHP